MDFTRLDLTQKLKQAEFASLVGISVQSVSAWMREGRLRRGDTGLAWLHGYLEWLREQAAGRGIENPLTVARARLAQAQAERAEMLARRLSGELIDKASAVRAVADSFREMRDALQRMPRSLAGHVIGTDVATAEKIIAAEIRRVLQDFASRRIPEAGVERMAGEA